MSSSPQTYAGRDASPHRSLTQEPKDEQNKKPPKIRSTCDACQAAKLRCSRGNPCFRCLHYGTVCRYSPSKPVGRPRRTAGPGLRDGGEKVTTEEKKANKTGSRRQYQEDRCSTASALSPGHSDLSSGATAVPAAETVLQPLSLPDATESWMAGNFTANIGDGEGPSRSVCALPAGLSFSDTTKNAGEIDWNLPHATSHGAGPASFSVSTTADPVHPHFPAYIPSNIMPAGYRTSPVRQTCGCYASVLSWLHDFDKRLWTTIDSSSFSCAVEFVLILDKEIQELAVKVLQCEKAPAHRSEVPLLLAIAIDQVLCLLDGVCSGTTWLSFNHRNNSQNRLNPGSLRQAQVLSQERVFLKAMECHPLFIGDREISFAEGLELGKQYLGRQLGLLLSISQALQPLVSQAPWQAMSDMGIGLVMEMHQRVRAVIGKLGLWEGRAFQLSSWPQPWSFGR